MDRRDKTIEIYEAALKVFADYGFKKATVEDIAGILGLTKGALYAYVKDKNDLYAKSIEYSMQKWQDKVRAAVESKKDVMEQFHTMCYKAFEYLAEDATLRNILIKDPSLFPIFPVNDPLQEINNASTQLLKEILERGIAEGCFRCVDVNIVSKIIFSFYKMVVLNTYVINDESSTLIFHEMINLITKGLFIPKQ